MKDKIYVTKFRKNFVTNFNILRRKFLRKILQKEKNENPTKP